MRCSSFRKNLSAFLDNELDTLEHEQMQKHLSECADCGREAEKFEKMISIVGHVERPEVPKHLWEKTRWQLETVTEDSTERTWLVRMPKWGFVPAAAALFLVLLYFLGGQYLFHDNGDDVMTFAAYLREHALSSSEQKLPSNPLSGVTLVQTSQEKEETKSDESMSELEMLVEVYYGINPTNGS